MRYILFFIAFVFALPAHAQVLDIEEITTPKGLQVWLVEDHSVPVISVSFAFDGVGSALDGEAKQGLARLVSNTMDEGAGEYTSEQFQKALQTYSIDFSYSVSRDDFYGSLKTLTKYKDKAIELAHVSLMEPRFDEEPVGRMRDSNISRIQSSRTDADWITARIMNDKAYEGHPYRLNSGGTVSSLKSITPDDLRQFHKRYIGKNLLRISIAGDVDAEEAALMADAIFADLPEVAPPFSAPDIAVQNTGKVFVYEKDIPQTVISIMQDGIARKDADYHTAQVMNYILGGGGFGSRLMEEVREKRGLTYGIYSYLQNMDHLNSLQVSTSTKNETVQDVLDIVKGEWKKFAEGLVSESELESAKQYLTGSLPLSLDSTDAISGMMLSLQLDDLSKNYLDHREERILKMTREDIARVAKRVLDAEKFITVLVGSPENVENSEKVDNLNNVD